MKQISWYIDYLKQLVDKNGPEESEWDGTIDWMNEIGSAIEKKQYPPNDINLFYLHIAKFFPPHTIHGLIYHKPHKYAGDYELLNRIQTRNISSENRFKKWDEYFHYCAAPRAVRFRMKYLHDLLEKKMKIYPGGFSFLNISSGACWDISEFYKTYPSAKIEIECVEHDRDAIELAKKFLQNKANEIVFYNSNILRFRFEKNYDFLWAAGLFDYLNDEIFVKILNRMISHTKPGGEIVIGNLNVTNPTKYYMLILQWIVIHRTEEKMKELARAAGASDKQIYVFTEPLGVNMFLHIQC
jgi:extracellular factor (EF) 3-hydroxypalmitic acid methyl ester biosynthesis protein